jgi:microcystin-dependent protein
MNNKYILVFVIILLILIIYNNNKEKFTILNNNQTEIDNEAIANIASLYRSENFKVTNMHVTGNFKVNGTFNYLPKGSIIMWNGNTAPDGWVLCDGKNDTPDLRGRFILGMGQGNNLTNRNINDFGGEETHIIKIDEIPKHNHKTNQSIGSRNDRGFLKDEYYDENGNISNWQKVIGNKTKNYTNNGDTNNISFTLPGYTSNVGLNKPINLMNPYYVLAYIMKL